MKILNHLLKLSIIFFLIFSAHYINTNYVLPKITITKQESSIALNNTMLNFFTLGQNRLIAGFLWIKTMLDSDTEHYKENNLYNWFYLNIKTINSLDKKFYEPYLYGGLYLSIIKDDKLGAKVIYEEGLKIFPDDLYLNMNAGFHSYFELKDRDSAVKYYRKALTHKDAPTNITALISRIETERDNIEGAIEVLESTLERTPKDSFLYEAIEIRLEKLKKPSK